MELPQKSVDVMEKPRFQVPGLGRCRHFFWLGVVFDAVGTAVLFTGVFANLLFYDMLLYLGSIIIFISLLWWISWYTGNIESLPEDTLGGVSALPPRSADDAVYSRDSGGLSRVVRSLSSSFLHFQRQQQRRLCRALQRTPAPAAAEELEKERQDPGGETVGGGDPRISSPEKLHATTEDGNLATLGLPNQWLHPSILASERESVTPCCPIPDSSNQVVSLTSHGYPLMPVTSQSHLEFCMSTDSHTPVVLVDPRNAPSLSLASQGYPLDHVSSRSHLETGLAADSHTLVIPVVPYSHSRVSIAPQGYPLERVNPRSHLERGLAADSQTSTVVPVDPHSHSNLSIASQGYPLERVNSRSHLKVDLSDDSQISVAPVDVGSHPRKGMTSENYSPEHVASPSHLQFCPSADSYTPVVPRDPHNHPGGSMTSQGYPLEHVTFYSHFRLCPSADSHTPVEPIDPHNHPRGSMVSQDCPLDRVAPHSHLQFCMSDDCHTMALGPQSLSRMSMASWSYRLEPAAFQSGLRVPVASESQAQGPLASQSRDQNFPSVSQTQPPAIKVSGTSTQDPVVLLGISQSETVTFPGSLAQISQSHSSGVQKVPTKPDAEVLETRPAPHKHLPQERLDTVPPIPGAVVPATQEPPQESEPTSDAPAFRTVRKSHPF